MRWSGGRATHAHIPVALFCLVFLASAHDARAGDPDGSNLSRAHDAYSRGAAAYAQGDYGRAARELAAADTLVPDSVTLRVALEAVTLADDPVLGADLVARAQRDPADASLAHAALVAQQRFAHRTGTIVVRCDGCLAVIDGAPARSGEPSRVLPGVHTVSVQRNGAPETRLVSVAADETREVRVKNRSTEPVPLPEPRASGLSPVWFLGAAAASVALGAVTVWSGVETANEHAEFVNAQCGTVGSSNCQMIAATGTGDQTRTLGLAIGTGVAVAGTALLGGIGVRWHASAQAEVAVHATREGAALRLSF